MRKGNASDPHAIPQHQIRNSDGFTRVTLTVNSPMRLRKAGRGTKCSIKIEGLDRSQKRQPATAGKGGEFAIYPSWNARAVGLDLKAEGAIEVAAEAGFEGVDLLVRDLVDSGGDVGKLRGRMDDLGLRGGAWPLPVNWRGDAARFRDDLERLHVYADAAFRLDLFRTGTWVFPECLPPRTGEDDDIRADHLVPPRTTGQNCSRAGQPWNLSWAGDHGTGHGANRRSHSVRSARMSISPVALASSGKNTQMWAF